MHFYNVFQPLKFVLMSKVIHLSTAVLLYMYAEHVCGGKWLQELVK